MPWGPRALYQNPPATFSLVPHLAFIWPYGLVGLIWPWGPYSPSGSPWGPYIAPRSSSGALCSHQSKPSLRLASVLLDSLFSMGLLENDCCNSLKIDEDGFAPHKTLAAMQMHVSLISGGVPRRLKPQVCSAHCIELLQGCLCPRS